MNISCLGTRAKETLGPVSFLIGTAVLFGHLTRNVSQADAMTRGLAGPLTWPRFALFGMLFCAMGWLVQLGIRGLREAQRAREADPAWIKAHETDQSAAPQDEDQAGPGQVVIWTGVVLALLYGFLIPVVGFPLATVGYLVLWLPLGGIRKPVRVASITLIGTCVLLYVFVMLASMPLDRGIGVFSDITLTAYRFLRIY